MARGLAGARPRGLIARSVTTTADVLSPRSRNLQGLLFSLPLIVLFLAFVVYPLYFEVTPSLTGPFGEGTITATHFTPSRYGSSSTTAGGAAGCPCGSTIVSFPEATGFQWEIIRVLRARALGTVAR